MRKLFEALTFKIHHIICLFLRLKLKYDSSILAKTPSLYSTKVQKRKRIFFPGTNTRGSVLCFQIHTREESD